MNDKDKEQQYQNCLSYPYHVINGIGESHTLYDVMILVEIDGQPAPNIPVLLMGENYIYFGKTNIYGVCCFPAIADEEYTLYLAKSGVNQGEFQEVRFSEEDLSLDVQYEQVTPKTVWNGMFATTPPEMYVDSIDGGGAYNES